MKRLFFLLLLVALSACQRVLSNPYQEVAHRIEARLDYVDVLTIRERVLPAGESALVVMMVFNPARMRMGDPHDTRDYFQTVIEDELPRLGGPWMYLVLWIDKIPLEENRIFDYVFTCWDPARGDVIANLNLDACAVIRDVQLAMEDAAYEFVGRDDNWRTEW